MQEDIHPVPFVIERSQLPEGIQFASNGSHRVTALDGAAKMFMRRGVKGLQIKPAAEVALPLINQFAGELLADPSMNAVGVQQRLLAIAGLVPVPNPERVEWLVVELDGVRVYCTGSDVIVTKQDLSP